MASANAHRCPYRRRSSWTTSLTPSRAGRTPGAATRSTRCTWRSGGEGTGFAPRSCASRTGPRSNSSAPGRPDQRLPPTFSRAHGPGPAPPHLQGPRPRHGPRARSSGSGWKRPASTPATHRGWRRSSIPDTPPVSSSSWRRRPRAGTTRLPPTFRPHGASARTARGRSVPPPSIGWPTRSPTSTRPPRSSAGSSVASRWLTEGGPGAIASWSSPGEGRSVLRLLAPTDDRAAAELAGWLGDRAGRLHHLALTADEPSSLPAARPACRPARRCSWDGGEPRASSGRSPPADNLGLRLLVRLG